MSIKKIKTGIEMMSILDVDRILLKEYKITKARTRKYPEDIKRNLLFDLETKVGRKLGPS